MRRGLLYVNQNNRASEPYYPSQQPRIVYEPDEPEEETAVQSPQEQPAAPPDMTPAPAAHTEDASQTPAAEAAAPAAEQPKPPKHSTAALMAMLKQHDKMAASARRRAEEK